MHRYFSWALIPTLGTLLLSAGCSNTASPREFVPGRAAYDTTPIDASAMHSDGEVLNQILFMPFGEAAARLGPMAFKATSQFVFSLGGDEKEQQDTYEVRQDAAGNFHVLLDTPRHQVERYLVGETVYVRTDRGKVRSNPRREIEAEQWPEVAFSGLRETLALFRDRLVLSEPTADTVEGRSAQKVTLSLGEEASPSPAKPPTRSLLPVAPSARWRELAEPLDLTGTVWVDDTGVILKSDVHGKVEIRDREVRPTQLELTYQGMVSEIGAVAPIEAPKDSVPEFRRLKPPGDLLTFFREHIPLPEEEGEGADDKKAVTR